MIRIENHCVGCPPNMGCMGHSCPYRDVEVHYCDNCGEEIPYDDYERYTDGDYEYCEDCYNEQNEDDYDEAEEPEEFLEKYIGVDNRNNSQL